MAPVDSGPIIDTKPLGLRKALVLAVKSRLYFLTGPMPRSFWVKPGMAIPDLSKTYVGHAETRWFLGKKGRFRR